MDLFLQKKYFFLNYFHRPTLKEEMELQLSTKLTKISRSPLHKIN